MSRRVPIKVLPGCRGRMAVPELRRVASAVLTEESVAAQVEVEVILADENTVQELNRLYRGFDEPTDVLSFATAEAGAFVDSPDAAPSLGEVIVCLPVAENQAARAGRNVKGEIAHLVVHGLLHILGYDHEVAGQAKAMQEREDQLLDSLGYAGAYAHGH